MVVAERDDAPEAVRVIVPGGAVSGQRKRFVDAGTVQIAGRSGEVGAEYVGVTVFKEYVRAVVEIGTGVRAVQRAGCPGCLLADPSAERVVAEGGGDDGRAEADFHSGQSVFEVIDVEGG